VAVSTEIMRPYQPALALFLLSPMIGELLSGSSPPLEFFNPFAFLFMAGLYGSGAVIIRELAFRWGKGWTSVLAMGVAYGIIEEGLEVKSFFDPHWQDIGLLGSYGRVAGVNWVWSVELSIFHAVFSIALPILLASLLFTRETERAWVSDRTLKLLFAVLVLDVAIGFVFLTPYYPPVLSYALAIALVDGLFVLAYALPRHYLPPFAVEAPRPRRFFFLGASFATLFFLSAWALPGVGLPFPVPIVAMLLISYLSFRAVCKWSGNGGSWNARHQLALAAGALSFLIALSFLQELSGTPRMIGMSLVGLGFIAFLAYLWVRLGSAPRASR